MLYVCAWPRAERFSHVQERPRRESVPAKPSSEPQENVQSPARGMLTDPVTTRMKLSPLTPGNARMSKSVALASLSAKLSVWTTFVTGAALQEDGFFRKASASSMLLIVPSMR